MNVPVLPCLILASSAVFGAVASAQTTTRVDVDSNGAQATNSSFPAMSSDGRYVAFNSSAPLVAGDTNGVSDVFVRDRELGITERVSVDSAGAQANGGSYKPILSRDGRFVCFKSVATNLDPRDTNTQEDLFVHDRQTGATELVSQSTGGVVGNGEILIFGISTDGRFVVFSSLATNLVVGDTNGVQDVFLRDRLNGTTTRVSLGVGGIEANGASSGPQISADGRWVEFASEATNIVAGDTNDRPDVFVRDRQTGSTELVSVDSNGVQGNDSSGPAYSMSADGRYVAFISSSTNLVPGDTNATLDVFVRDRQAGTTERVNVSSGGAQANGYSWDCHVSDDGRFVAFLSTATNLVPNPVINTNDLFLRDRLAGTTEQDNVDSAGVQANGSTEALAGISADGRFVGFSSWATNLVVGDTNATQDVFVRDRTGGTTFTSLCDPGVGGVRTCPCGNPPSGLGRGCDNSTGTGGASLAAAGATFLSSDSLVFTTSGERATATSLLMQGTLSSMVGNVRGQGVGCVGGPQKRLYTKSAVGGSIRAPNLTAGDPTISARSAAKGDPIAAGQSRWYIVTYRDPIVLGGCPAASTFNVTQTGQVTWSP